MTRVQRSGRRQAIDEMIGSRLRERRKVLGLSQSAVGDVIGVTYQQVQKYERGNNRLSVGTLIDLCAYLEVPVSYFLEDLPG